MDFTENRVKRILKFSKSSLVENKISALYDKKNQKKA